MKIPYRPERQRIEGNVVFCHSQDLLGRHSDVVMKSFRELTDDQLAEQVSDQFTSPLIYLREASPKEISQYCIKK